MLANTSTSFDSDGAVVHRLYSTNIVKVLLDGVVELQSGGYRTQLTKQRMNLFLAARGWKVYSYKGEWILTTHSWSGAFSDGMRIGSDGRPLCG